MKQKIKTFSVINLGCRVNLFESTAIIDQLIKANFKYLKNFKKADIVIINTCTVTSRADRKCRNYISKIKKLNKILVVIGCFSQINYDYVKLHADITIGNKFKNQIPELINQYLTSNKKIVKLEKFNLNDKFEQFPIISYCENTRAIIKIQDGCDFMCSYCLIPYARGRQRSLKHEIILNTIKELVAKGFYELVLTGVNTAGYKDGDYLFIDLLKDINKIKGNFRVRISSIEPFQINHQIIDLITSNQKRWVQEFHLCLQAANNQILESMHRKYTIEQFIDLCKYIRSKNNLASITTDYIVGFDNETDANYHDCLKNLKKIKFSYMNIFPYSVRKNTAASFNKNKIDELTKFKRVKEIHSLLLKFSNEYLKQFLNKTVEVWFENSNQKNIQCGHSQYYFMVYVKTTKKLTGNLKKVKITKLINNRPFGQII